MTMYQQKCPKTDIINIVSDYLLNLPFEIENKHICVCLSGGADSVALLRTFLFLKEKFNITVSACHFNHCLRDKESDSDEQFCVHLCNEFNVELFLGRDDVAAYSKVNKKSLEEAARECRYSFFKRILSKQSIDYCATAHNMNDDAETLLLNLVRGAGFNGASAIEPYSDTLLRPFLLVKREQIEAFLTDINQKFVTDSSNFSNEYSRNYLRNVIFPALTKLNPAVVDSFSRFINLNRLDREYFESIISSIENSDLRTLHVSIRRRYFLRKYKEFSGRILNNSMLVEIDKALFSNIRSIIPLFDNDTVIIDNGKIFFDKKDFVSSSYSETDVSFGGNCVFDKKVNIYFSKNNFFETDSFSKKDYISEKNIVGKIKVRSRQIGDKIIIKGVNKSLKKLFIDNKIPKEYRNIIPIFFDDVGIIYVPFVGITDRVFSNNADDAMMITTVFNTIDKERWSISYEK